MGGNWKGSRCALLPVLMHKVWWREDTDLPFLHPGTMKGKDSPIWSSGLCALQSTGQVDSSAFAWSDYWEITALHLNWHFCLSLMSELTEGSGGGESILLCGYKKKNSEALAGTPSLLMGMAALAWIIFLKIWLTPQWMEWSFHFLFGCLVLCNRYSIYICL